VGAGTGAGAAPPPPPPQATINTNVKKLMSVFNLFIFLTIRIFSQNYWM
jgi:hypothetical protein